MHDQIHHETGACFPSAESEPQFAAINIHDTDHATANRKYFSQ